MTAPFGRLCRRALLWRVLFVTATGLALAVASPGLGATSAADSRDLGTRLDEAQRERATIQQRLDSVTRRLEDTRAAVASSSDEVERLRAARDRERGTATSAEESLRAQVRETYKRGSGHVALRLLAADDASDILEQTRLLAWVTDERQENAEAATATAVRAEALADHAAAALEALNESEAALREQREQADALLERALEAEEAVKDLIAEQEAERARLARASRSTGDPVAVTGGVACPVGSPRTYVDSWGAPRSGGRRHAGTDIMAPHGTVTPAYESGVIMRLSSNSLGGISLYLRGDSGNVYYYTHLSGYAGVAQGQRVTAGQVIAHVGSTGNAGGINHLHFEVRPGGGASVNPYPYVRRACG